MAPLRRRIALLKLLSTFAMATATTNTSDGRACEARDASGSVLRDVFFDASCIRTLDAAALCPSEEADVFIEEFSGELRFEGLLLNMLTLLVCVSIVQVGGIPIPKDLIGKTCWFMWTMLVLVQWLTVQCSLWLLLGAYWSMAHLLGPCMIPWQVGGGVPFLHAATLPYFVFQPRVFFLLCSGMLYAWMAFTSLWVFNQTHSIVDGDTVVDSVMRCGCCHPCHEKTWSGVFVLSVATAVRAVMVLPVVAPLAFCAFAWLLTASFVFSLVFLPVTIVAAVGALACFAFIRATRKFIFQPIWECVLGKLPPFILTDYIKDTAKMFWWMQVEQLRELDGDVMGGGFQSTMIAIYILAALSPCVCYGSALAWYVYGGHSTKENMELVKALYSHYFGIFIDAKFEVPAMADIWRFLTACGLDCYEEWLDIAFEFVAGRFDHMLDFGPLYFLEGSTAIVALNFLLNLLKPLVPLLNASIICCCPCLASRFPESDDDIRNISFFQVNSMGESDSLCADTIRARGREMCTVIGAAVPEAEAA